MRPKNETAQAEEMPEALSGGGKTSGAVTEVLWCFLLRLVLET